MPHLRLEVTNNILEIEQLTQILEELVACLSHQPTVASQSVKAYCQVWERYAVGENHPPGFVHLTVQVLDNRSDEVLTQICDALEACLGRSFQASRQAGLVGLTLETRLMKGDLYRK